MKFQYVPVLIAFGIGGLVAAVFVAAGMLLGPRRISPVKSMAFECGNPPSGPAWGRFSGKSYLTPILFIVFDVEVVFVYPSAGIFPPPGAFAFVASSVC